MLFLNERGDDWEVWRGEDLCSARLVRVFQTYAEALAYYDRLEKKLEETERQIEESLRSGWNDPTWRDGV